MTSPAAPAAVPYSTFNSLRLGRSVQSGVGRLIRFWDSRNINKNGEFMGITIIFLLDELDSMIHSFIPANRASQAGSIVRLDRFEVARVAHIDKITEHQFVIRFIPSTRVVEVQVDSPVIKSDKFMVRRFDHLQVLANTNLELPGNESQSVMVVITVNPKNIWRTSLCDQRLHKLSYQQFSMCYTYLLPAPWEMEQQRVDTMEGIKKEFVSIGYFHTFISNSTEQTHEAEFLFKAQIIQVRVELAVDDRKDSATFVIFDRETTKLIKKEAMSRGEEMELPKCLKELAGNEYVFQLRVSPYNFTPNHRMFTVSAISKTSYLSLRQRVTAATHLQSWIWNDKQQNLPATWVMHQRLHWELLKQVCQVMQPTRTNANVPVSDSRNPSNRQLHLAFVSFFFLV